MQPSGLIEPVEPALLQVHERLLDRFGSRLDRSAHGSLAARRAKRQRVENVKAASGLERKHAAGDLVHGVLANFLAALCAEGSPHARIKQAKVIVDFGGRSHGRPGVSAGVFLLDGDRSEERRVGKEWRERELRQAEKTNDKY